MKKLGVLFLMLCMLLVVCGCTDSNEKQRFIGTWRLFEVNGNPTSNISQTHWIFLSNDSIHYYTVTSSENSSFWQEYVIEDEMLTTYDSNLNHSISYEYAMSDDDTILSLLQVNAPFAVSSKLRRVA